MCIRDSYLDIGEGPLCVFVHGTPGWSYEWRHVIKHLPGRVVVVDHIGFGLSDRPDYPLTLHDHASNFKLLIDSLDCTEISFVVHDFGGPIALESLVYRSYMIKKIILVNTWFWPLEEADASFFRFRNLLGSQFIEKIYDVFGISARYLTKLAWGKARPMTDDEHRSFYRMLPRNHRMGTVGFLKSALSPGKFYGDYINKLKALEGTPSLLIWGRLDPLLKEGHLRKWQEILPELPAILLSKAGHWPHLEDYESVGQIISQFLAND